jgi:UDP-N-acetylmuramoyl-L-alanyl-D-glutamate--2,6-diaminopimelate ligase
MGVKDRQVMAIARNLSELFQELTVLNGLPEGDLVLSGIKIDSREITSGDLYLAIRGTRADGHDFVWDAVGRGAAAVVGTRPEEEFSGLAVPYLQVKDTRQTLADLTAAWYGFPARQMIIVGVTGTDGKTTTANLIYQILLAAGIKAGLISTVNAVIGERILDTGFHVTTPEALDVQFYLSEMLKEGISHVVLEATSHGLAQKRVAACEFDIGLVTNITHEHLDFHGDYQGYLNAKAELFRLVSRSRKKPGNYHKSAIFNKDDQSYQQLSRIVAGQGVAETSYGIIPPADFLAENIHSDQGGISFDLVSPDLKFPVRTVLIGDYNVSNCLAAAAACLAGLDLDPGAVQEGISNLSGIPGRMENFPMGQDFLALVDFAHTPNALHRAIKAAREFGDRRIIAVFGSAGLRDREKRRMMAKVSGELADLTVLTAEDPRTESLDGILEEMAGGVLSRGGVEGENFWRVPDRGNAIRFALQLAGEGDVVLVCGKGHEQSMCFGEIEYPWDDRIALQAALAEYLDLPGPEMPFLPTRDA